MRCLASAKFSMLMDIIKPVGAPASPGGSYTFVQNPDSGALEEVWIADPFNPDEEDGRVISGVPCLAKAAITSSIRAAEKFGAEYINDEWVKVTIPFNTDISLRDKVRNIRTSSGNTIWSEEESSGNPPTIFDVYRVSPVVDGFGQVVEKVILIKRSEVQ